MPELTFEQQSKIFQRKIISLYKEIQGVFETSKTVESDATGFSVFRGKFRDLEKLHNEFMKLWDELYAMYIAIDKEKEFPLPDKYLQGARNYVYECNSVYENIMNPAPDISQRNPCNVTLPDFNSSQNASIAVRARLPKICIPPFNGDLFDWPKFRDLYSTLVHEEISLSAIEKFHYLVGYLSGEPLRLITSFSITAMNYESAWKALIERYNNKRILASAYLHKIRQFKLTSSSFSNSAAQLRTFLKVVADSFTALSTLKIPDEADYLKLQLALDCLEPEVRQLFEENQHGQEFPKYDSLISFIQRRCQILELSETNLPTFRKGPNLNNNSSAKPKSFTAFVQKNSSSTSKLLSQPECPYCKANHCLFKCFKFKLLDSNQRSNFVQANKLCINCLRRGHFISKCASKSTCLLCKRKHHTLLHKGGSPSQPLSQVDYAQPKEVASTVNMPEATTEKINSGIVGAAAGWNNVLLGTALVNMQDFNGTWQPVRIIIDSGSQFSIITADCARRLGLLISPSKHIISGIGRTQLPQSKGMVRCVLQSLRLGSFSVETSALVMPSIVSNLPTADLPCSTSLFFDQLELADDRFWESRPVEFLLGSDLFFQILTSERKVVISESFGTLPTIFGHVVMGIPPDHPNLDNPICLTVTQEPLSDELIRSFWEIEDIPASKGSQDEHQQVEKLYAENVCRLPNGRYMVALPLINPHLAYSTSRGLSTMRFLKLESRFRKEPILKELYSDFMKEYLELGHMSLANAAPKYVIPHHAIVKPTLNPNESPRLRVVFDASMRTYGGSLNENLLPGPKLQKNVSTILLNFRTHCIVFCTDIVKMFRQILVVPEHRPFQTVVWRFSPEESLQLYELNTLTYGEASSPYLAMRTIRQLIQDEGTTYPRAAGVLSRDIYVDDIISGAETVEEAIRLKSEIISLLGRGCFPVHKWASNSSRLLESLPEGATEMQVSLPSEDNIPSKILGMHWDSKLDVFSYKVQLNGTHLSHPTKRAMLSVVARLFDPLGFLAPTVLLAKSFIQELWALKLNWDDPVPQHIFKKWTTFIVDLPRVNQLAIPRCLKCSLGTSTVFGFCDASEKAYAAAVYLRTERPDFLVHSFLLTARTRLAPVKTISIPKLELCAAHLLVKLINSLKDSILNRDSINNAHFFTDSTIVLSWLRLHPQQLKTFVANRITYILEHTQESQWQHVPSAQNPADIASRGTLATSLIGNELWWNGPTWLRKHPLALPTKPLMLIGEIPEKRVTHVLISTQTSTIAESHVLRHSKYPLMVRSLAYAFRYLSILKNGKNKLGQPNNSSLTVSELQKASHYLIKGLQHKYFVEEFDYGNGKCLSSRFQSLMVFSDSTGMLRVGGRLSHSSLSYETKHPIVLPHDAKLTIMIVDHYHQQYFHMGAKALQAHLQREFHIFGARSLVRKRVWNCLRCFKLKAKPNNPLMADLPISRVNQGRPFTSVGVDFAGPYFIKQSQRRNAAITKAYMCIFVCMAVKATHIELVSSLTTEAFLQAFDRFTARRGLPSHVYSDRGTNFIGAARYLRELYLWYEKDETRKAISRHSSDIGIQWHFNPPAAPHFGGLWEAAVKSTKTHLRRTLGDRAFYFEELTTIFSRIEAVLNSRPLCAVSSNPTDFDYLSPGHFLIGAPLIAAPERSFTDVTDMSYLRRWQLLQASVQIFWRRWSCEYIPLLQRRTKWTKNTPSIKIGDLVLIQDANTRPLQWQLGRVTEVYPDNQGVVRVASVGTPNGELKRPVHRLAPLDPINKSN